MTAKNDAPSSGVLLLCIPFLFVATIALAVGAKGVYDQWSFRKVAIHGTGRVTGYDSAAGSRNEKFHPLVRYETASGQTVQFRGFYTYPKSEYPLEQAVDVLYDPANPTRAEIDSSQSRYAVYMTPAFGAVIWIVCLIASAVVKIGSRSR